MGFFISKISEVVMALKVGIIKSSDVSKWCEYKGADGEVQADFKVRGIAYKPFQVAMPQSFLILVILAFQSGYSLKNKPRRFRKMQTRTRL